MPGKVIDGGIVSRYLKIIDDLGFVAIYEFSEKPTIEQRQTVPLFPRVDRFVPSGGSSDGISWGRETPPTQGHGSGARQETPISLRVRPHHLLRIGLQAHVAHHL